VVILFLGCLVLVGKAFTEPAASVREQCRAMSSHQTLDRELCGEYGQDTK
jgi:hypothetical protein